MSGPERIRAFSKDKSSASLLPLKQQTTPHPPYIDNRWFFRLQCPANLLGYLVTKKYPLGTVWSDIFPSSPTPNNLNGSMTH